MECHGDLSRPFLLLAAPVAVCNASASKCRAVCAGRGCSRAQDQDEYHPWIPTYSLHNAVLKPEGADLPVQAVHKLVKTCR